MNTQQLLAPVSRTLASVPRARINSLLSLAQVLGWVGLTRNRSRWANRSALLTGGVLLGAAAALLLTPASGRDLRSRLGKRAGGGVGRQVGKVVGEQVGAHPVTAAEVARKAHDIFAPKDR
jgi:hypothetical protein